MRREEGRRSTRTRDRTTKRQEIERRGETRGSDAEDRRTRREKRGEGFITKGEKGMSL